MSLDNLDVYGPLFAIFGIFFLFLIIIGIALYIYFAIALMTIAKNTKTKHGWLAFIPIANIYLMTQIGKLPGWYTFGILLAFIPILGPILVIILAGYIQWKLAERINRPGWWGILLLIPIVKLIIIGVMAWGTAPAPSRPKRKK
ncbi:hypothetical protein CMO83_03425 [Candidatus Woesearchaeota archaeon]|jgi:hypothetical protein|nr:hypothetical protein [Candidatus Woesearchaeota archaeon]|tara:strand:- start:13435 stop:13866 length:432 start_codon:yes stop_codon:yes gene_type:complete